MCRVIIFLFLIILSGSLPAQEVTKIYLDSLLESSHYNYNKVNLFYRVQELNALLKVACEPDTISYRRSADTFLYTLRGDGINVNFNRNRKNKFTVFWSSSGHGPSVFKGCEIVLSDDVSLWKKIIQVRKINDAEAKQNKFAVEHYSDGVLNGPYVELDKYEYRVYVNGQYTQMDSVWRESAIYIDPMTYEVIDSLIVRNKYPVKSGEWLYFNEEGDTLKVEYYPRID